MKLLAFDTTNSGISIAILQNSTLLAKTTISESGKQAEILIPEIEKILHAQKIWYQDLDLIAATKGPGSFTGVRIGMAVARTLRIATNLPLILIDSLEAVAFKHREYHGEILVAIDARMDEFFVGKFFAQNGKITTTLESQLVKLENIKKILPTTDFLLCGSGKKIIAELINKKINDTKENIEADLVGLLALEKSPSLNHHPLYLREAKITERKK